MRYRQSSSNIRHVEHKKYDTKEKTYITWTNAGSEREEKMKVKPPELQLCKA